MKIKLYRSGNKQFYFNIVAKNGRVIATSETYLRKVSMLRTINNLFRGVPSGELIDVNGSLLARWGKSNHGA